MCLRLVRGGLEAEEWDYETFRREKLRNWADTSVEYAGELFFCAELDGVGADDGRC